MGIFLNTVLGAVCSYVVCKEDGITMKHFGDCVGECPKCGEEVDLAITGNNCPACGTKCF